MAKFPETRISLVMRLAEPSDVHAWQEFVDIYAPALFDLALRRGLQASDAEDVTQEILIGVAQSVPRFEPDPSRASFRTWLRRIARNLIADFYTRRSRQADRHAIADGGSQIGEIRDDSPNAWEEDFDSSHRQALMRLAASRVRNRVHESTWLAFERTFQQQISAEDVAEQLQVSLGSVYVARCRVIKLIREEVHRIDPSCGAVGSDQKSESLLDKANRISQPAESQE